jgi:hypothetical protein
MYRTRPRLRRMRPNEHQDYQTRRLMYIGELLWNTYTL